MAGRLLLVITEVKEIWVDHGIKTEAAVDMVPLKVGVAITEVIQVDTIPVVEAEEEVQQMEAEVKQEAE